MGWNTAKLGEVCEIIKRGVAPKYIEEGGISVINQKCIKGHVINYSLTRRHNLEIKKVNEERYVQIGDVLVNSTGTGTLGRVAQVRSMPVEPTTVDTHVTIVRPKKNLFHNDFFGYMLIEIEEEITSAGEGTSGQTELARTKLENEFAVSYPDSIPEQKRIVSILDQAFADLEQVRAKTEQNLKNARELFDSYLQQVFSQRGEGWIDSTLGHVGKVSMCKRILKKQTSSSGDIPFYKIGTFGKEPNAFITNDIYEEFKEKYSFPKKGEILISASGTIGRRVIYDGKPAYFQDSNIVWIDNNEQKVLNEYLYVFYGICDWNPSKGATIARLYNDDLRRIKIQYPVDKLEQRKIVIKVRELADNKEKLDEVYKRKLSSLDELKKSILQKAFSGELIAKAE